MLSDPVGRRRASTAVAVTATLAALSMSLTACGDDSAPSVTADCVIKQPDGSYKAVNDSYCDNDDNDGDSFIWIYGGSSHNGYIGGGTRQRPHNTNITSRTGKVVVGGFGGNSKGGGGS